MDRELLTFHFSIMLTLPFYRVRDTSLGEKGITFLFKGVL